MNALVVIFAAMIAASAVIGGPLLSNRQRKKDRAQRAREKAEDRKREDEVAAEALRQQEAVAAEKAKQDKEASEALERAAALLLEAQKATTAGTEDVRRALAEGDRSGSKQAVEEATPVVLFYENGQREEVILSGVPDVGHRIRLRNGRGVPALVVTGVLWMEAFLPPPNPSVIIAVTTETKESDDREMYGARRSIQREGGD